MSRQPDPFLRPAETVPTVVDADGRVVAADPTLVAPVVEQPVMAQPVMAQPVIAQPVVTQPAVHQSVATTYGRHYAFDSVVVGIVGLALLILGLIAVTRAGFDGSMEDPVVEVMGFNHTVTLGLIEVGIGVCLLICAAVTTRGGAVFFGLLLGVAGFVGAVQTESFDRSLAIESGHAWLAVIAAIVVVAVSLLMPRVVTRTDRVEAI